MKNAKRSKISLIFVMTLSIILGYGPTTSEATAATSKRSAKAVKKKSKSKVGEGLRRKKNHTFDGMTVEGLNGGRYDSITSLSEGGDRGGNHLYSLPANFSYRAADEKSEMRYR